MLRNTNHPSLIACLLSNTITSVNGFTVNNGYSKRTFSLARIRDRKNKGVDEVLIPLDNPSIDPNTKSISDVTYGSVLAGLDQIYPPNELSKRNAISRTDGYWSFIEAGEEPPKQYTYGEFDLLFFAELLDKSFTYFNSFHPDDICSDGNVCTGKTFLDIGSGAGRLVLGAAALHPTLKESRGLEILPGIHKVSIENLEKCKKKFTDEEYDSPQEPSDNETILKEEIDFEGYKEPLTKEMNEMQEALQGMTAEEWKAILADLDLDDDLFDESLCEDDEVEKDENESCTNEGDDTNEVDYDGDDVESTVSSDSEQGSSEERFRIERTKEHFIIPDFVLVSDDEMLEKIGEDEEMKEQYFGSIEEFMECTQLQWDDIFGNVIKGNTTTNPILIKAEESSDIDVSDMLADSPQKFSLSYPNGDTTEEIPLSPICFTCGSFQDPYIYVGDANVIFVFSSCMTEDMMKDLSDCLGRCKTDTIVISTEFMLEKSGHIPPLDSDPDMKHGQYEIELLETVEGFNWVTDKSTAYIQRVTKSVWDGSGPRERPRPKPEDEAIRAIRDLEAGNLTNTDKFMRRFNNNMAFNEISDMIKMQLETLSTHSTTIEDNNRIEDDIESADAAVGIESEDRKSSQ